MKIKQVLKIILFVFIVTVFTVSPFLIGTVEAQAGGQGFAEALENIMGEQGGVADTVAGFFGEIPAGLVSLTLWILKGFAAFFFYNTFQGIILICG